VDRARQRAAEQRIDNVAFEVADAQTHDFAPHAFDVAISQLGVMFFDDPHAAFANIAQALRPGGRLAFVCWRERAGNEGRTITAEVLAEWIAPPPPSAPGRPGAFSLAEADVVKAILAGAGFRNVALDPLGEQLNAGRDAEDAADFLYLDTIDEPLLPADESRARDALVTALRPRATAEGVLLHSSAWLVTAASKPATDAS
jgi:SAM-dependent methyltransferase